MHISALNFGKLFFETYCTTLQGAVAHDIGAQNVNGSLKDVCPPHLAYVGVDFVAGPGVDIILDDPYHLPFADNSLDVLVCSSCFEHSQFFWLTFLEMLRVLKPEGLLYLNVPSNGSFHRYPVDCWRFYPDAGGALEAWARKEGYASMLLESFVGLRSPEGFPSGGAWNDFVAVFVKDGHYAPRYEKRMLNALPGCWNGLDATAAKEIHAGFLSPDHSEVTALQVALQQQEEASKARENELNDVFSHARLEEQKAQVRVLQLEAELIRQESELERISAELESTAARAKVHLELAAMTQHRLEETLRSRSWRATSAIRRLGTLARKLRSRGKALVEPLTSAPVGQPQTTGPIPESVLQPMPMVLDRSIWESEAAIIAPTKLFDEVYYRATYADMRVVDELLREFCETGWRIGRNPSADFDTHYYLETNPDIRAASINPLLHYVMYGMAEGRQCLPHNRRKRAPEQVDAECEAIRPTGLFDPDFYLSMYADIQPKPADALRHYCEIGWLQGRNPSDRFDTTAYLEAYGDIANAGVNPLWHYAVAGAQEFRYPDPGALVRFEDDIWFGHVESDVHCIALYHSPDWMALNNGSAAGQGRLLPHIDTGYYDSTDAQVLQRQAQLAQRHGIHAFCFSIGAQDGDNRSLQTLETWLANPDIALGFVAALELSTGRIADEMLELLARAHADTRWLRVNGKPMLLVKPEACAEPGPTVVELRRRLEVLSGPVYLVEFSSSAGHNRQALGYDASILGPQSAGPVDQCSYAILAARGIEGLNNEQTEGPIQYPIVELGCDATSVSPGGVEYRQFHLKQYRQWLDAAIENIRMRAPLAQRFVFANGWNDWRSGRVLEADRQEGYARLNETTRALMGIRVRQPMPKVSVIVANYNHERFLRRRLDSIYGQTYRNFEVLLLDDCSSDESRALMDSYATAYPHLTRRLYNETNSGSAFRQWAKGIHAVSGDLVWIAESDDYCDEHFLEVLVRCFDDEAVMLASGQCVFVNSDEVPLQDEFKRYVSDLACAAKWQDAYVETAHNEVSGALGIKNTIPNASGVVFRRPIDMPLLSEDWWLSMRVAGDWVFYLHLIRGGKIAYAPAAINYFRRYEGSTAESTYRKRVFYEEVGLASKTVALLYDVPQEVLERCRKGYHAFYQAMVGGDDAQFDEWYGYDKVKQARALRQPNIMVSTMGFLPGGAEIFPIRLANEFKRQGLSVLLLSTGLSPREDGIRRMLRNDVPVVETSDLPTTKALINAFGVEVLNSHQWHVQKYPALQSDVFDGLDAHVATLHGMIEHGAAFGILPDDLKRSDSKVSRWVYTADKNLAPFVEENLYAPGSSRFTKLPNGIQKPLHARAVPRAQIGIPEDAFVLCCVSRAIPDKGWQETVEAVRQARELSARDIHLILVGNGPVYDEFRRAAMPAYVHLIGFSQDSVGYYATADMGIMLTKFRSESFPLTIIDCLFADRPFIATQVGEISNMLTLDDHVAGALFELENWEVPVQAVAQAIASFASDEVRYRAACSVVSQVVGRFSIEEVASRYGALFKECVPGIGAAEQ